MEVKIRDVPATSEGREDGANPIRDDNGSDRQYHPDTERHDDDIHFAVVGGMLGVIPTIEHLGDRRGQADSNDGRNRKSSRHVWSLPRRSLAPYWAHRNLRGAISVFQIDDADHVRKLEDVSVQRLVHSLAVDLATHRVYTPEQEEDGQPVARMIVYDAVRP